MSNRFFTKGATISVLLVAAILPQVLFAQSQWSIGYLESTSYTNLSIINWNAVTHISDFTVAPNANGTLMCDFGGNSCSSSVFTTARANLISTAHSHGVKVLMCVSDGAGATGFSSATSAGTVNTLVSNIMALVNANGYDGVDIDWESGFPANSQVTNFLAALRTALGSGKILNSTAIVNDASFWASNHSSLNRVEFMTYDLEGNWNPYTWFNSALYSDPSNQVWSIDLLTSKALAAGMPAGSFTIGIPFYGYVTSGPTGPRQTPSGNPVQTTYSSLLSSYSSQMADPTVDSVGRVPWFSTSSGWVEYDNAASITAKVDYAKSKALGGWILFSLNKDASGQPLASAVAAAMGTSSNPSYTAPSITSTSPLSAATVGTAYSMTVISSGSTPMTWALTSGSLPSGLSLNSSSGAISGMPTTAGSSSFTVQASNAAGTGAKQFSLTVSPKSTTTTSWFNLVSKNSGLCLDVPGMSTSENVQLQQWTCSGGDNQKFQFTPVQGGYEITAKNSGLQLNVRGGTSATQNGVAIIQWPYSGASNEIWNTVPNVNGSYAITALNSGKCMDVTGVSKSAGALIQQWQCTGNANQQWSLVPAN